MLHSNGQPSTNTKIVLREENCSTQTPRYPTLMIIEISSEHLSSDFVEINLPLTFFVGSIAIRIGVLDPTTPKFGSILITKKFKYYLVLVF